MLPNQQVFIPGRRPEPAGQPCCRSPPFHLRPTARAYRTLKLPNQAVLPQDIGLRLPHIGAANQKPRAFCPRPLECACTTARTLRIASVSKSSYSASSSRSWRSTPRMWSRRARDSSSLPHRKANLSRPKRWRAWNRGLGDLKPDRRQCTLRERQLLKAVCLHA
eukprot:277053-Chlamydomonas_euryale.AAC.1